MNAKDWSHSVHPVPFDIKDFNEGIENYSNGVALITEIGFQIGTALCSPHLILDLYSGLIALVVQQFGKPL